MNPRSHQPEPNRHRWTRPIAVAFVALYVTVLLGCAVCQRRLIYFPRKCSPAELDELAKSTGLKRWKNLAGQNIGWKRMSRVQPAAGQGLITHGNAGCALDRVDYANIIDQAAAMDVLILEYPGFGDRAGSPSESGLFMA